MLTIRKATVDDAEHIAAVHTKTWQVAYADLMPPKFLAGIDVAARADMWRRGIDGGLPPGAVFVAETVDEIVGFHAVGRFRDADGIRDDRVGEVIAIYVTPGHWSTGAGSALMRAGVDHLVSHGLAEIRL